MRLQIKQELLSATLTNLNKVTAPRSPTPALRGILLETVEGKLLLNASDGEMTIRAWTPAEIIQPGKILLPADSLTELVRRLEPGILELEEERTEEGAGVILRWKNGQTRIWIMEAENYPPLLEASGFATSFTSEELRLAMLKVLPAASREEAPSKAILRGVHLTVVDEKLQSEATDGIRLAVWEKKTLPSKTQTAQFDAVLPLRAVLEFSRFSGREGEVFLSQDENHLVAQWTEDDTRYLLMARRVTGRYPNTHDYIPVNYCLRFRLPTALFVAAVERAIIINKLDSQTYPVKIRVDGNQNELVVMATSSSVGIHKERITLDHWSGEPLELAFNARFLLDGLKNNEEETTHFASAGVEGPAMITGEDTSCFYLLLPLRLG